MNDHRPESSLGLTYRGKPRTCGLRFSVTDGVALLVCGVATYAAWPVIGGLSLLFPYVLGHFFLFCNVFRIRRQPEIVWAVVFILTFGAWSMLGNLDILVPLLAQLPLTVLLIALECRRPTYHGVLARRINASNIRRYLDGEIP